MADDDTEFAGMTDLEIMLTLFKRSAEREAKELAEAKAAAAASGKEPFDLAKLETMCDTSSAGRVDPLESRQRRFESMYYVEYPQVRTLAELAEKVYQRNQWS